MQSSTDAYARALEQLDALEVAALLEEVPGVVSALRGRDPSAARALGPSGHPGPLPVALPVVAGMLARPETVVARLRSLDRFCFQLATLASVRGGRLDLEDALAEAGVEVADALEDAAERLRRCCLAERDSAWLALLPGVAERIGAPGVQGRPYFEMLGSDDLATILRNLGVTRPPSRKGERLDLLEACLDDPELVRGVLAEAPSGLAGFLRALLDDDGGVLDADELEDTLGLGYESLYYFRPVPPRRPPSWGGTHRTALHWLTERGLVAADSSYGVVFMPLEALAAVRGWLFVDWDPSPDVPVAPLVDPVLGVPGVLALLDALLRRWERQPADGLKAGGLGVRVIRAAASALGRAPGEVGLLAHLAVELDLVGSIPTDGGYRRGAVRTAWTTTALADDFRRHPPVEQWALLVAAWCDSATLDESAGLPERVEFGTDHEGQPRRQTLLEVLAALPEDQGVDFEGLATLADHRQPTRRLHDGLDGVVACLRLFGIVPAQGPIGLSRLGRALVTDGPDAVAQLLPPPADRFTVQPDHSVIAPPNLNADVLAGLERYATLESDAGASIHRLDETRIAAALDAGETGQQVLDFLAHHAAVALPQNVEYLVRDVERRHGRVRIGAASSYVTSDDPALIVQAVGIKPAKLRQLAPTVAVSSLSRAKLLATLGAKGLMPVAEGADGAQLVPRRQVAEPELDTPGPPGLPVHGLLGGTRMDTDLVDLAQRILDTPELAGTAGPGRGGRR